MSMIGNYLKLSEEQLETIIKEPSMVEQLIYPEDGSYPVDLLDIDKSWHLIHFLLNGEAWNGEGPLLNVVLGGHELPDTDAGYGPYRYLKQVEVSSVSDALGGVSANALWEGFVAEQVQAAEIYPTSWIGDDGDREYISQNFDALKRYFSEAAAAGKAMLLYLS